MVHPCMPNHDFMLNVCLMGGKFSTYKSCTTESFAFFGDDFRDVGKGKERTGGVRCIRGEALYGASCSAL